MLTGRAIAPATRQRRTTAGIILKCLLVPRIPVLTHTYVYQKREFSKLGLEVTQVINLAGNLPKKGIMTS